MNIKAIYDEKNKLELYINLAEATGDMAEYYRLRKELKQLKQEFDWVFEGKE